MQANWVIPPYDKKSPAYDGTVCLSKAIFLDGWLLPKLTGFNTQTQWVTTSAWWKENSNPFKTPYWGLDGHVGINIYDVQQDPALKDVNWVVDNDKPVTGLRKYMYERHSNKEDDDGAWRVYMKGTLMCLLLAFRKLTNTIG